MPANVERIKPRGGSAGDRAVRGRNNNRGNHPDKRERSFPEMSDQGRTPTPATKDDLHKLQEVGIGGAQGAPREKQPSPFCPICGRKKNQPMEGREPFVTCGDCNEGYKQAVKLHQAAVGNMSGVEIARAVAAGTLRLADVRPPTIVAWALGVVEAKLDEFEQAFADAEAAYQPHVERVQKIVGTLTDGEKVPLDIFRGFQTVAREQLDAEHAEEGPRVVTNLFYAMLHARGRYYAAHEFIDRAHEQGVKAFVPVAKAQKPAPETPTPESGTPADPEDAERQAAEAFHEAELAGKA